MSVFIKDDELTTWYTTCKCGLKSPEIKARNGTNRYEIMMLFDAKGWQLFPSRCPGCKNKIDEPKEAE